MTMAEWIVLGNKRAINLAQVSDIKFVSEQGVTYATVRLATFDPTTGDKEGSTWFNVTGVDLDLLRAYVQRRLAPEFEGRLTDTETGGD